MIMVIVIAILMVIVIIAIIMVIVIIIVIMVITIIAIKVLMITIAMIRTWSVCNSDWERARLGGALKQVSVLKLAFASLYVCRFVCLFVCLSLCLFVCLSVCSLSATRIERVQGKGHSCKKRKI